MKENYRNISLLLRRIVFSSRRVTIFRNIIQIARNTIIVQVVIIILDNNIPITITKRRRGKYDEQRFLKHPPTSMTVSIRAEIVRSRLRPLPRKGREERRPFRAEVDADDYLLSTSRFIPTRPLKFRLLSHSVSNLFSRGYAMGGEEMVQEVEIITDFGRGLS